MSFKSTEINSGVYDDLKKISLIDVVIASLKRFKESIVIFDDKLIPQEIREQNKSIFALKEKDILLQENIYKSLNAHNEECEKLLTECKLILLHQQQSDQGAALDPNND